MHSRCFATLPMTSDFRNPFLIDNKIIFLEKSLFWVINKKQNIVIFVRQTFNIKYMENTSIAINSIPPRFLHRYFNFQKGMEFLRTGKLRLASVFDFNDPFESFVKTKYPMFFLSLREGMSHEQIRKKIDILSKQVLLNKDKMWTKASNYIFNIGMYRMACFSEVDNDILMWGHYGRGHKGILVTFDTNMHFWGNDFYQVNYSSERLNIKMDGYDSNQVQRLFLMRKAECWTYEKEWRYILPKSRCIENKYKNGSPFFSVNPKPESVAKIVIGCKMGKNELLLFQKVIKKKWPNVKICRAQPTTSKYSLEIKDITDWINNEDLENYWLYDNGE